MPKKANGKLRIIPLGGLNEIGKNMTVIEYENDMIVVDCGVSFPDDDMPGIDLVIPDTTYLENNIDKLHGIVLTHGHEDHIGAIPYVLRTINTPVYGTRLTLGIIENKLMEHKLPHVPDLRVVAAGDTIRLGVFTVEFIHTNHSIADACALTKGTEAIQAVKAKGVLAVFQGNVDQLHRGALAADGGIQRGRKDGGQRGGDAGLYGALYKFLNDLPVPFRKDLYTVIDGKAVIVDPL